MGVGYRTVERAKKAHFGLDINGKTRISNKIYSDPFISASQKTIIPLPNASIEYYHSWLYGDVVKLTSELEPKEFDVFYKHFHSFISFLYSSPDGTKKYIKRKIKDKDGKPFTYEIMLSSAENKIRLLPIIPSPKVFGRKVKFDYETANGYELTVPKNLLDKWFVLQKAKNGERVLQDAVSNLGFEQYAKMDINGGIGQVCVVPRFVNNDEFKEVLERVFQDEGNGIIIDAPHADLSIVSSNGTRKIHGLMRESYAKKYLDNFLDLFDFRPYDSELEIIYYEREAREEWKKFEDKTRKIASIIGAPIILPLTYIGTIGTGLSYLTKPIDNMIEKRKKTKRQKERLKEEVITSRLRSLGVIENYSHPDSCFIALSPEEMERIEKEVDELYKQRYENPR